MASSCANNTTTTNNNIYKDETFFVPLATVNTTAPCKYHPRASLYIPGLSLSHDGGKVLFQPSSGISSDLTLLHGQITALVGTNGCGKSSTAKVLASFGSGRCDSTNICADRPKGFPTGFVIEYLVSDGVYNSVKNYMSLRPREYIQSQLRNRLEDINRQIEELDHHFTNFALSNKDDSVLLEQMADDLSFLYELEENMANKMNRDIDMAMTETGFINEDKSLDKLSVGWRYKCQLIASLLSRPDMLVIDEPSFLDGKSMAWFMDTLRSLASVDNCIIVLISHKEMLLEEVCDRVVYINSANQSLTTYNCGYRNFRNRYDSEVKNASKAVGNSELDLERTEKQLKQIQGKMKVRAKNLKADYSAIGGKGMVGQQTKTSTCLYRSDKCQRADKATASRMHKNKQRVSDLQELREKAKKDRVKPIIFKGAYAAESTIVSLLSVGFCYPDQDQGVFRNVDTTIECKDQILLSGDNGQGKSTLVKLITGEFQATEGDLRRKTEHILYFPQTALQDLVLNHGRQSSVDFIRAASPSMTPTQARNHLARMGLDKKLGLRDIHTLSSGQRVRLWLAYQLLKHPTPSLLILDEISENLDQNTRQSLVDLFDNFEAHCRHLCHLECHRKLHPKRTRHH